MNVMNLPVSVTVSQVLPVVTVRTVHRGMSSVLLVAPVSYTCMNMHSYIYATNDSSVKACQDGCTGALFDEIDRMAYAIARFNFTDFVPLPWNGLFHHQNTTVILEKTLIDRREEYEIRDRLITAPDIFPLAQITVQRARELEDLTTRFRTEAADLQPVCAQSLEASIQVSSILEGNVM